MKGDYVNKKRKKKKERNLQDRKMKDKYVNKRKCNVYKKKYQIRMGEIQVGEKNEEIISKPTKKLNERKMITKSFWKKEPHNI